MKLNQLLRQNRLVWEHAMTNRTQLEGRGESRTLEGGLLAEPRSPIWQAGQWLYFSSLNRAERFSGMSGRKPVQYLPVQYLPANCYILRFFVKFSKKYG